jgi:exonuclease SbcC
MKILAIRGKNLASLSGEFDIPFDREPLASAGLFAISGPTGAGKSTLLDALCLALYDDTPRLLRAGGKGVRLPDVDGETVTPDDTCTLLRRGASEGYAEVDFVGNDDTAYRARWSVRRSRSRADGKLQKPLMTLMRLPELQPVGGTNTEVKAEIVQRIGLSFEQFTRSVLLAQNEFSAFLKADDNERGELLETLTGIVIYTEISRRAFERAKQEQLMLTRLNDRLADQKPLSQEARAMLDLEGREADAALIALELQKAAQDEALRWHQQSERMTLDVLAAETELESLQAEHLAAAPRRSRFERIEAVQDARVLLLECERSKTDIDQTRLAIGNADAELHQANQALLEAEQAREQGRVIWQDAVQGRAGAAPDLDRAKALDAQLETLLPLHRHVSLKNEQAQSAEQNAISALNANQLQSALAQEALEKICDWQAAHAHLELLADNWPRWDTLLDQASRLGADVGWLRRDLACAEQDESRLADSDVVIRQNLADAVQVLSLAQSRRVALQAVLDGFDVTGRLAQKLAAESRRDRLTLAEQQWRELASNLAKQWELNTQAEQLQDAIRQAEAALLRSEELLPVENAALLQAERSLKIAEAACAKNVETLRDALVQNEACPVCGSPDHPYRRGVPQLHAMLDGLRDEVVRCRERVRCLQEQHTTQSTLAAGNRRQTEAIAQQLHKIDELILNAQSAWDAGFGEVVDVEEDRRAAWFSNEQLIARESLQLIAAEERAERDAALARDRAQGEFDRAARLHNTCIEAATKSQVELAAARAARLALENKYLEAASSQERTLADLDAAFAHQDWMIAWRQSPERFHANCKKEVGLWQSQVQAQTAYEVQLGNLAAAHQALQEARVRASAEAIRSAAELTSGAVAIELLRTDRDALFGGRAAEQVQQELDKRVLAAKNKLDGLIELAHLCANTQTRLNEALAQAGARLALQLKLACDADAQLDAWIERFNESNPDAPLTIERLRELLGYTAEFINNERKQLQHIESKIQNIFILLRERRTQLALHEQKRQTSDSADEIRQALSLLDAARSAAQAKATALQLEIAQDIERRRQSASMLFEIEKQEAAYRLWAQLSDLIGSADGKKFRNYAQQFTLDVLLGYANQHLSELSRRYRLERIANTLALMVLDRDMGDEQRSVHSLSGGESFLVSLALALGLASLSSNRVRVESLFIDEGFGSLDPETLSVAMDALDGLQAMGRRVGVISHVQEMTERISTKILVQRQSGGRSRIVIV